MTTKAEFEQMILEAIRDEGDLMTVGADNGVNIDTHGPIEGSSIWVEGWHKHYGGRSYFGARVTVELEEYEPDYDYGIERAESEDDRHDRDCEADD